MVCSLRSRDRGGSGARLPRHTHQAPAAAARPVDHPASSEGQSRAGGGTGARLPSHAHQAPAAAAAVPAHWTSPPAPKFRAAVRLYVVSFTMQLSTVSRWGSYVLYVTFPGSRSGHHSIIHDLQHCIPCKFVWRCMNFAASVVNPSWSVSWIHSGQWVIIHESVPTLCRVKARETFSRTLLLGFLMHVVHW